MEIVNVITVRKGILEDIFSFPIPPSDLTIHQIKRAEALFTDIALEKGAMERDIDMYLENGNYDNGNGFEVNLIWSIVNN